MLILILILLLIILIICLYQLFKLIKWTIKKKKRMKWASGLVGVIALAVLVNHLFFKKMEFIQSKVYPDLYLIKYPIKDKDSLHKIIAKMVFHKVSNHFKTPSKNTTAIVPYRIRFYEYYSGTPFFVPFGEAGTTHFIENKEDPGGFSSEYISDYNRFHIAEFNLKYCRNDSLNYIGTINYYQNWDIIKTDIIINQCNPSKIEESVEAESVSDIH